MIFHPDKSKSDQEAKQWATIPADQVVGHAEESANNCSPATAAKKKKNLSPIELGQYNNI